MCAIFIMGVAVGVFLTYGSPYLKTLAGLENNIYIEVLKTPLAISGDKNITANAQALAPGVLSGKQSLVLSYDLRGACLLNGPASALTLKAEDGRAYDVSLASYGQNCAFGEQVVRIPLSDFAVDQPMANMRSLETQFWYPTAFSLEIRDITAYQPVAEFLTNTTNNLLAATGFNLSPKKLEASRKSDKKLVSTPTVIPAVTATPISTVTPIPTSTPIPPPTSTSTTHIWSIRSVSSMKETKDKICNQDSASFIEAWIGKAIELGVNYIAVETPYDNPTCGSAVSYTKAWVDAIHVRGLNVWHRHMPLAFEGIYSTTKNASKNYLQLISDYIKTNPTFFKAGDIFTPIPEPQNGGIYGITYCPQSICIFSGAPAFNQWLRDAITTSESAFSSVGLAGKMKIGYYGFDGFVTWGDNNPDWDGILEGVTVQAMGNITIDHYPEIVGDTMENDLNELQAKYPTTPIVIGEWGTITGGDIASQVMTSMQAALRPNVIGFNYWHFGIGGNEALLNDGMTNKASFTAVKSFFTK